MGDPRSPTPAARVSISPAREAYLAYERSSPATRRPLSDFIPHLRLAATMAAYGHSPGNIYRPAESPPSDPRESMVARTGIPIQEVDDNQGGTTEEDTVYHEHELTQLQDLTSLG